jgi:small subunit ribosomal protein S17
MDKTVVIRLRRRIPHKTYGKFIAQDKKYYAHDKDNICQVGDVVRIEETRPLSKLKRWRVVEIVSKGVQEAPGPRG